MSLRPLQSNKTCACEFKHCFRFNWWLASCLWSAFHVNSIWSGLLLFWAHCLAALSDTLPFLLGWKKTPGKHHLHKENPRPPRSKLPAQPECCPTCLSGNTCFPMGFTATMRLKHILDRLNSAYMLLFIPNDNKSICLLRPFGPTGLSGQPCLLRVPRQINKQSMQE